MTIATAMAVLPTFTSIRAIMLSQVSTHRPLCMSEDGSGEIFWVASMNLHNKCTLEWVQVNIVEGP